MTKREVMKAVKNGGTIEVVAETVPHMNKFGRTRDAEGKRIANPFEGLTKVTKFKFNLDEKYVPVVCEDGEEKAAAPFLATGTDCIKVAKQGKHFYLFGKAKSVKHSYKMNGKTVKEEKLAEFKPSRKGEYSEWNWIALKLESITSIK